MSLICLVTAMTAEAKPLVEAFNLKPLPQKGLRAWTGDGVCLVQTGMGQQRAEARIDALLTVQLGINAFINVGIAGGDRAIGDVIIASSVQDKISGRIWYPHLPPKSLTSAATSPDFNKAANNKREPYTEVANTVNTNTSDLNSVGPSMVDPNTVDHCAVISVPEPCDNYRKDCVYDMEASAVTRTVLQHTDLSRIQTVKVISDNPTNPLDDFSVKNVTPWMCNTLPTVEALINWLSTDSSNSEVDSFKQQVNAMVNHITAICHHSVTETHQLRRYLERFLAMNGQLPTLEQLGQIDSSQKLLQQLENELTDCPVNY